MHCPNVRPQVEIKIEGFAASIEWALEPLLSRVNQKVALELGTVYKPLPTAGPSAQKLPLCVGMHVLPKSRSISKPLFTARMGAIEGSGNDRLLLLRRRVRFNYQLW